MGWWKYALPISTNSVLRKDVIVLTIPTHVRFPVPGGQFGSGTAAAAYTSLPDVADDDDEEAKIGGSQITARTRPSQAMIIKRGLSWTFHVAVALLALYGGASLLSRPLLPILSMSRSGSTAARTLSCNCGETVAEARANGCVYDSLAAAWLPPHCRSEAITAEFEAAGPLPPDRWGNTWGYWADQNQTQALTVEEVSLLPEAARRGEPAHFFATHEWHVLHCVYYWRKMWEAGKRREEEEGRREWEWEFGGADDGDGADVQPLVIEKRYDTLMHIQHCMAMLMKKGVDPDSVAAEAGVALHSDQIHVAKPHRHGSEDGEDGGDGKDPYDKEGAEGAGGEGGEEENEEHEHQHGNAQHPDPYDEEE
ncbi:hypothetical protein SLS62_003383 [Diatrype stigma]|uniref:Uncharacterized protein n=1 Tax=Diatrype stigma TaxID=117547 RepID=A0AAN9UYH1_9PEZI